MSDETQKALFRALYKVLRPMVRLLMRHGVSYRLFADIARHAYVDVAREDFSLPGRKQSLSRMAVLTGINRKDIAKLLERPHPLSDGASERPTAAARVITGWLNDVRFHNAQGEPAELIIDDQGNGASFGQLVRDYSTDVPVRALLDELERIQAVSKSGDRVALKARGYIPMEDMQENVRIFGTAAEDLLSTMDHNISKSAPGPFIQRTVSYSHIPVELLDRIRQRSAEEGQTFLLKVNDWLAEYDRESMPEREGAGKARAGIGLYYFQYPDTDDSQEDNS
ncbi:DUF6502 family protein [Marinimicrobium sp. ABcell2]|uniref:DUF6502 family protein n=1 Tax=Marinimicrobium sp. ABcell2 TaxID=3069751 RepID=UPI0027B4A452|nr:DUF6502 family protein [Marinimicrobium sp. ABcell2]MDQ2075744.1 DUF6502 family protein [Marinimicrobium sp. ABcell2]